jgi:hypothetical protein
MLSLEVVGPGYGLSTAPSATPYWRDASWRVSWQAATATAAYSCDRAVAAPHFGWGAAGGGDGGVAPALTAMGSRFQDFLVIRLVSFRLPNSLIQVSVNSARFVYLIRLQIRHLTRTASKVGLFL